MSIVGIKRPLKKTVVYNTTTYSMYFNKYRKFTAVVRYKNAQKKILITRVRSLLVQEDSCTSKLPEHDSSCSEDRQPHPRQKKRRSW